MARYRCLRKIDMRTKHTGKLFVPGMIYEGDVPKCGKGTDLTKPSSYMSKKGPVEVGPVFELIKEEKAEEVVGDSRTKAQIAFDILANFDDVDPLDKLKKAELLAYEQELKGKQ